MGKYVYLDTNVIDHLVDHSDGLSQEDADRLVTLSSSGEVEPIFNILGFQEQLGARSEKVERLFDYTSKLFNPDKVVKDSNDLFHDDIESYAHNGCADTPYYSGKKLATLQQGIKDVIVDYTPEKYAELYSSVVDPSRQKSLQIQNTLENAVNMVNEAVASQAEASQADLTKWRKETLFQDFWKTQAESWAECFADGSGVLAECKKRGIQGLLEIRSVRMGVGDNYCTSL